MAKNTVYDPNDIARQEENIRKARGNPNRNVHTKRKNSNYGGYTEAEAKKPATVRDRVEAGKKAQLPKWMQIALFADLGLLAVMLVLRLWVFPDSAAVTFLTTLLLGLTCLFLFYVRRVPTGKKKADTTFFKVIQGLLLVVGAIYAGMGLVGLASLTGLF